MNPALKAGLWKSPGTSTCRIERASRSTNRGKTLVSIRLQAFTPGTAEGAAKNFLQEHKLERYLEAVDAATRSACKLPGINSGYTLVIGHSEGGIVASRLAVIDHCEVRLKAFVPLMALGPDYDKSSIVF